MEFKEWLGNAWNEHATDANAVASRIVGAGAPLATRSEDVAALARLAHHVYGEHLARFEEGRACMAHLRAHEHAAGVTGLLAEFDASLALAANAHDARAAFDPSARIRITALTAGSLLAHDSGRAGALLREAVSAAAAASLADQDPACRTLAIAGNQIACGMEEKATRSDGERELMIFAARTGREFWARAGTWLETERAEYRLSQSFRHAGDVVAARRHAQACLEIVDAHGAPALESFFGWEALALAERDAGNASGQSRAVAHAQGEFERLDDGDRAWCKPSLDALVGSLP